MTITQQQNTKASPVITVFGVEYALKRDATDPASSFDHRRVTMIGSGCDKIQDGFYACWIYGALMPASGSIERPQSVFYLGFHREKISMLPQHLTERDLQGMHVYASDATGLATAFIYAFLSDGAAPQATDRAPISCNLVDNDDD